MKDFTQIQDKFNRIKTTIHCQKVSNTLTKSIIQVETKFTIAKSNQINKRIIKKLFNF